MIHLLKDEHTSIDTQMGYVSDGISHFLVSLHENNVHESIYSNIRSAAKDQ